MKNILPGGKADKLNPQDFDPKELKLGIKTELEHTNDKNLAREIAMDHLAEFPNYYTKLLEMEKSLKENQAISPFRQNYDYGENFINKIQRKQKRSSNRKIRLIKLSKLNSNIF